MKATKSLLAVFIGLLAACVWDFSCRPVIAPEPYVIFLTFVCPCFLGWVLFVLPVVYFLPQRMASRWYVCVSVGIFISLGPQLLLNHFLSEGGAFRFPWSGAILGVVGGIAYWLLNTGPVSRLLSQPRTTPKLSPVWRWIFLCSITILGSTICIPIIEACRGYPCLDDYYHPVSSAIFGFLEGPVAFVIDCFLFFVSPFFFSRLTFLSIAGWICSLLYMFLSFCNGVS